MTYKNEWFEGRHLIRPIPVQAVIDCSRPGSVDSAVDYWVRKLNFDGPSWFIREHLRGFGAWEKKQLCDHKENLQRLFWSVCCDIAEDFQYDFSEFLENSSVQPDLYLMY